MRDLDTPAPRHPNPDLDAQLKVGHALKQSEESKREISDEAFREALSHMPIKPSGGSDAEPTMPDGGSRYRTGEGEFVRYTYDRPGADRPAQTVDGLD